MCSAAVKKKQTLGSKIVTIGKTHNNSVAVPQSYQKIIIGVRVSSVMINFLSIYYRVTLPNKTNYKNTKKNITIK